MCSTKLPTRNRWPAWAPRQSVLWCGVGKPPSATRAIPAPTYVQQMVDCGTITEEEAEHHPQKNIITRALGVDYRLEPEVTSVQLQAKDLLLLCSDGLTNMVPVEQMEQLLAQGPFYDLPDRLVDAANENGGSDNITALLLAVEPTEVHHG